MIIDFKNGDKTPTVEAPPSERTYDVYTFDEAPTRVDGYLAFNDTSVALLDASGTVKHYFNASTVRQIIRIET